MITATDLFCLNELGRRSNNEDCVSPPKGAATAADNLFVVCDGVGGEKRGEVASELVCTSMHDYFQNKIIAGSNAREIIQQAINHACEKLAAYVATDAAAKRMSTTLALVLLGERSVTAAWCGDTRIHHIRNGRVVWKSKDHSLVSELIAQGELTEEEARTHPRRNVITRSLNALHANSAVDFHEITGFETGDYLLLCTDGLLEHVTEKVIHAVLTDEAEKDKAKGFSSYCNGITKDNFSMYLIRAAHAPRKLKPISSRSKTFIAILLVLVCIATLFFIFLRF